MAIKLGGGGGGANIPYKGSTAEILYKAVTEGTYYNLNSSGKLVPSSSVLSKTGALTESSLASANGYTTRTSGPFYTGQYEGQMPNGNILSAFSAYTNSSLSGIAFVVLDSTGSQVSNMVLSYNDANHYQGNFYSIESMGEDNTNYIFTAFTKGQNSSNNAGAVRGHVLTVRKSDNHITFYSNGYLVYNLNSTTVNLANDFGGSLQLARNRSVYCSIAFDTAAAYNSMTFELSSGTVSGTYGYLEKTTTSIPTVHSGRNVQLIKYDDSSANFLLAYHAGTNTTLGYVIKKVLVAADGTHTVTDITPSALSQGTGSTQQRSGYLRLYKSEDKSKFLLMSVPSVIEARYQKTSYDGSTLTVGSLQKYNTPSSSSADYLFRNSDTTWQYTASSNSLIYRYAEDKLYLAPRATYQTWSNYSKGAVWSLGSGSVTGTAVQTDRFDGFLIDGSLTGSSTLSTNLDGVITEKYNGSTFYITGHTPQVWDTSSVTLDKIAYARQSGDVGQTVNISLIEGVTSSDTLSSTYWLNKEDMYYEYNNAVVNPPAFSYLKPVSYLDSTISASTINGVTLGDDAFKVTAPEGQYLKIESYYASSTQQVGLKIDGAIFAEYVGTSTTGGATQNYKTILNGNSSGGPSMAAPIVCREFSIYRTKSSTISGSTYVTYSIGEPA